jgi:hypothetical protein
MTYLKQDNFNTRWFKYDRDDLCVNKSQFVPVIFEPPCTMNHGESLKFNKTLCVQTELLHSCLKNDSYFYVTKRALTLHSSLHMNINTPQSFVHRLRPSTIQHFRPHSATIAQHFGYKLKRQPDNTSAVPTVAFWTRTRGFWALPFDLIQPRCLRCIRETHSNSLSEILKGNTVLMTSALTIG